jgi:hypothetical protein
MTQRAVVTLAKRALTGLALAGAALTTVALVRGCEPRNATPGAPTSRTPASGDAPNPAAVLPPAVTAATVTAATVAAPTPSSEPLRFLALGGGPTPESNEVSLEQDIELVRRALPGPGLVLFAGGSSSPSVRELDPDLKGDPLKLALGELFAPRNGRHSRYRLPRFDAERATLENVEARLSEALSRGNSPLLVYFAGHGEQGSEARSNSVALWGGQGLSVSRLAELHERQHRPLRLVATSCFSGGFAELAFAHADGAAGRPSPVPRCGLFGGTADRETSGCDPDPDRRAQESYGLHVAHALSGTRKDGSPLSLHDADFDHDGKIGLLDAHTWARIEAISVDVPTTTSERWLRRVESGSAPINEALSPEDAAVVHRLGAALGLTSESVVKKRWGELDRQLEAIEQAIDTAEGELAERSAELATSLLERWPVLDDPFHPSFEATLQRERAAIEQAVSGSAPARARGEASERSAAAYARLDAITVEEARVFRLLRAYETLHAAAALDRKGGAAAKHYRTLLSCERAAPE